MPSKDSVVLLFDPMPREDVKLPPMIIRGSELVTGSLKQVPEETPVPVKKLLSNISLT
jgi:hypothetical protein